MADKMSTEAANRTKKQKVEDLIQKVEDLINEIENLIKDKLKDKTFINKNPFIDASKPIETSIPIDSLPLALKNFGKEEEKNWIFYGPPGTGKTFALNKISPSISEYVINPDDCNAESPIVMFVKNNIKENDKAIDNYMKILPYCLYLFLANPFNKSGVNIVFKSYGQPPDGTPSGPPKIFIKNKEVLNLEFRYADYPDEDSGFARSDVVHNTVPNYDIYYSIVSESAITKIMENFLKLRNIDETFINKIRENIIAVCNSIIDDLLSYVTKIVFHPSYTYEDFIGGIKPDLVQIPLKGTPPEPSGPSSTNSLTYKYTLGVMLDLIRKAWDKKGVRHYLIIDEFNRGNIAAIFGEFLYLIENDKRSKDKNSGVDYVFLPGGVYPWDDKEKVEPFSEECKIRMPENIFIVGALNTADRSIATMDFAMRRRFNFVKFEPNEELIKGFNWIKPDDKIDADNYLKILFLSLNKSINYKLDADHEIGHYYFMPTPESVKNNTESFLEDLFERKIIPLLEAYCDHDEQTVYRILALTKRIMKETFTLNDGKINFTDEFTTQKIKSFDRLLQNNKLHKKYIYTDYIISTEPSSTVNEPSGKKSEVSLSIPSTLPS